MSSELVLSDGEVVERPRITPEQAKVDAIAALTMKAYDRAGMLELSADERKALTAEFPDDAFRQGAGGDQNLIYIEHAALRDRFNEVLGPGQWAIVPRSRWTEPVGDNAVRVYVEAMLVIRGCFMAEAIGDMTFYPNNARSNYGDAVQGATSTAFRRLARDAGVGTQAWKKNWCDGWWARKRGENRTAAREAAKIPAKPPNLAPEATQTLQEAMADQLDATPVDAIPDDSPVGKWAAWLAKSPDLLTLNSYFKELKELEKEEQKTVWKMVETYGSRRGWAYNKQSRVFE